MRCPYIVIVVMINPFLNSFSDDTSDMVINERVNLHVSLSNTESMHIVWIRVCKCVSTCGMCLYIDAVLL